jgi:hypothetical protein
MGTFDPWPKPHDHKHYDLESVQQEVDRLNRALRLATIAYHDTKKDLQDTREAHGYYKMSFQFLRFPREVRDQIYRYCLQAPLEVQPEPMVPVVELGIQRSLWKPPSQGLCLANKQVWSEAREILYGENRFSFSFPAEMLRFEEQIGVANHGLVRSLGISCIEYPNRYQRGSDDFRNTMEDWTVSLKKSKFVNIVDLKVSVEVLFKYQTQISFLPALQKTITTFLRRNKKERLDPRLTLVGFQAEETRKFPKHWKIRVEQWPA